MKKLVLFLVGLLIFAYPMSAQVLSDCNTQTSVTTIFHKAGDSGPGLDSVYWAKDPSNAANGVMALHISFDSLAWHARMELGTATTTTYIQPKGAKYLTFWVYLDSAQKVPDSLQIDTYGMDNKNWSWTEIHDTSATAADNDTHYAKDIPKNVWFPISFPIAAHYAMNKNFDIVNGGFMTGLQFFPHQKTWRGTIYVDNIALIGALPSVVSDCNTKQSVTGFFEKASDSGYGLDSLYLAQDPSNSANGVMALRFTFDSKQADTTTNLHARFDIGSIGNATYIKSNGAQFITYWVYLDTAQHVPDSLGMTAYAMDNKNWQWYDYSYYAKDIPKNVWYPLSFPLEARRAINPSFDIVNGAFMTGMQFWPNPRFKWHGIIYVDNVSFLSEVVAGPPPVWYAADFETSSLNGFRVPSYGTGTLSVVPDLKTSNGTMVLQAAVDLSKAPRKFAMTRPFVMLQNVAGDSVATGISLEMFLPNKMPLGALVKFMVFGTGSADSVAKVDTINNVRLKINAWNTLSITKLDSLKQAGKFDPSKPKTIGVMVYYPADTSAWKDNIWFDNLTVFGISRPGNLTFVAGNNSYIPETYELFNNYPNPFNPSTVIKYNVPKQSKVAIQVFDVLGREVATLVNEVQSAGSHEVTFNASKAASGVYFVRMTSDGFVKSQRMLLLK